MVTISPWLVVWMLTAALGFGFSLRGLAVALGDLLALKKAKTFLRGGPRHLIAKSAIMVTTGATLVQLIFLTVGVLAAFYLSLSPWLQKNFVPLGFVMANVILTSIAAAHAIFRAKTERAIEDVERKAHGAS